LQGCSGFIHDQATTLFEEKVSANYLCDDHKPEFPSKPYSNLDELTKHITDVITRAQHECEINNWYYAFIGCEPFANSFASAHVHCSIDGEATQENVYNLRKKLYSVQPFIVLLSQNSPISNGTLRSVKSTRLAYSTWSDLTHYDSTDASHYLSLAQHRKNILCWCR